MTRVPNCRTSREHCRLMLNAFRSTLRDMRCRPANILMAVCVFLLTNAPPLRAQVDIEAAEVQSIRRVIERQIDAFKRDDAAGAYALASPTIRKIFPTAEIFMRMVRQGYQPVYRPRSFSFDELTRIDGKLVQVVRVVGPDGVPVTALYIMERQPDESWRIGGCFLTRAPGKGI